jgi:hypothetical protein
VSTVFPSSQPSPVSTTPSPHRARRQSVRQASAAVSEFRDPVSHSSPKSTISSPQENPVFVQWQESLSHRPETQPSEMQFSRQEVSSQGVVEPPPQAVANTSTRIMDEAGFMLPPSPMQTPKGPEVSELRAGRRRAVVLAALPRKRS